MNIKDLIGGATEYDKKQALEEKRPKSWCKSVSAFANTFGGALIFGISDDGRVVGLGDPERDAEKISEAVKTRLEPEEIRFFLMYSIGLDIWSVKGADLERLSVDMNFKLIIMRTKDHHSVQIDISLL